jgi:hypothetical protein
VTLKSFKIAEDIKFSIGLVGDFRSYFQNAKRLATKRSMSNKRLVSTGATFLLSLFLIYSSFFYFPAFNSKKSIIKIVSHDSSAFPAGKNGGVFSGYFDYLLMNRGFLNAGQTVSATYDLSPDVELKLIVIKCSGPVIVEIYSCRGRIVKTIDIGKQNKGHIDLNFSETGFYRFSQQVLQMPGPDKEFRVDWKRI